MIRRFKENGDQKMVQKLEAAPVTLTGGTPDAYRTLRDPAMHSLGIGTTHDMNSVVTGIFLPSWQSRDYTLSEKFHTWTAKAKSGIASLWDDMLTTNLTEQVTHFTIPVYFFSGVYDYTVNYTLAKDYFEKIEAPIKGFYTFEESAHSPIFEEPEKVQKILREDVLPGGNSLADR
jgi:pimeloyl-ACP methyl ester carboxylesterase